MNPMQVISVEKLTLNIGAGKDQGKLDKSVKLIEHITGKAPVKTYARKRVQEWGLRLGLAIGCKLTMRGPEKMELVQRLIDAKEKILEESNFDEQGNISFGIAEYIDIPGVKYDPDIGILGLQVCITLTRPGFRIKRRSLKKSRIPEHHRISQEESIEFMKKAFGVQIGEDNEL